MSGIKQDKQFDMSDTEQENQIPIIMGEAVSSKVGS
jgi:hypothetical protein